MRIPSERITVNTLATKIIVVLSALFSGGFAFASDTETEQSYAQVFSGLAMDCIHKEYSNKIAHYMTSDDDLKPPPHSTQRSMAASIGTPRFMVTGS